MLIYSKIIRWRFSKLKIFRLYSRWNDVLSSLIFAKLIFRNFLIVQRIVRFWNSSHLLNGAESLFARSFFVYFYSGYTSTSSILEGWNVHYECVIELLVQRLLALPSKMKDRRLHFIPELELRLSECRKLFENFPKIPLSVPLTSSLSL